MEDQDYSTGFGTLTLPLSLLLIVRHTERIPSCFEDFNIFRTAAQMQLKFFIKNFDQYDFLLPPTNRVLSGLRSKPRLSITFLGNSLRISSPSFNTSKMMKYHSNLHNNTVSKLKTTRNSGERWLFPPHVCWNSQLLGFSWWLIQRKTWCTIYPGHLVRLRDVNQHEVWTCTSLHLNHTLNPGVPVFTEGMQSVRTTTNVRGCNHRNNSSVTTVTVNNSDWQHRESDNTQHSSASEWERVGLISQHCNHVTVLPSQKQWVCLTSQWLQDHNQYPDNLRPIVLIDPNTNNQFTPINISL